jgi:hypothetical protein
VNASATSLRGATEKPTRSYVLVTGGRDYKADATLEDAMRFVAEQNPDVIWINGAARGADTMCSVFALKHQQPCYMYPAEWNKYPKGKGNPAGPIRNTLMLDMHPDIKLVMAFHDFLPHSSGTYDMCRQALQRGIPVLHYDNDGLRAVYPRLEDLPPQKKKEGK